MNHLHMQARVAQLIQVSIFCECEVSCAIVNQQTGFVIDDERRRVRRRNYAWPELFNFGIYAVREPAELHR
jgi:hypothetical protein